MNLIDFQDDIILLAIFLLLGFITREVVKPLQKLYIPPSVIGGVRINTWTTSFRDSSNSR